MLYTTLNRTGYALLTRILIALSLCISLWIQPAVGVEAAADNITLTTRTSASLSPTAPPAELQVIPTPFRAVYEADYKGLPIRATGIRELRQTGDNQFTLSSTATSFFASVSEESNFTLTPENRLMPVEYQYHRKGIGKNRDDILRFDWPAQQVMNDAQPTPWTLSIPMGTLDKLSYQLQMRYELLTAYQLGQPWPALAYQVTDGGELKTYRFEVLGEENVDTPIGRFTALKIARVRTDSDRTTIFWLAPAYDFLLVRFLQEEQKGGFELILKEAKFRGEVVAGT